MNSSNVYENEEYRIALDRVDEIAADFRTAHRMRDPSLALLTLGRLIAAGADVYNLSPPSGFFHPSKLFRTE